MWKKLLQTNDDTVALVLRLALGIVFFPHGMQKLFGRFGGIPARYQRLLSGEQC